MKQYSTVPMSKTENGSIPVKIYWKIVNHAEDFEIISIILQFRN